MNINFLRNNQKNTIWVLGFIFALPYLLGVIFPEQWWGTHFISFLPLSLKFLFLTPAILLFLLAFKNSNELNFLTLEKVKFNYLSILIISLIFGFLFYHFPIVKDYYGNARTFIPILDNKVDQLPVDFFSRLFSLKIETGNGRNGVMLIYQFIAYLFNLTYQEVFTWMGAICGSAFIFLWLLLIKQNVKNTFWRCTLALMCIGSPFLLVFFGHIETYAFVFLILTGWLFIFVKQLKSKKAVLFIPLVIVLLIGARFHVFMYLLAPALGLSFIQHYLSELRWVKWLNSFKGMFLGVYLPICCLGAFLYFFVFEDYNDSRILDNFKEIDRLFLPLVSPEVPLDKYNLFSWNHIFDYTNILFLWSPVLIFLSLIILFVYRKNINQNIPVLVALSLTFLIFITILFVINPLMSMPMDWDLFLFPVPILMVMLLLLVQQIERQPFNKNILIWSASLIMLSIPIFVVNHSLEAASYRMETVGKHVYKTYYAHSSTYLLYALQMIPNNPELYQSRKNELIKDLENFAIPNLDKKYASLYMDNGFYKLRYTKQYQQALNDFEKAHFYYPKSKENTLYLMESHFILRQYKEAYKNALELIEMNYPSNKKAIQIGVHCALEAALYQEAFQLSIRYLESYKDDGLFRKIYMRLKNNERIDELKFLFHQKED